MENVASLKVIVLNFIAFFILLFVMAYVIWPKINAFLEARQKKIEDLLKLYQDRNDEVSKMIEQMKQENDAAYSHRQKLLEEAKKDSMVLREEMIEKAYHEAEGMIERAKQDITKQRADMVIELRENISKVVVHAVETILGNVIDEELDHKVILETEKRVNIQAPA